MRRWKEGYRKYNKEMISVLKADPEFSYQMAEYDSLARTLDGAISESNQHVVYLSRANFID